jgi:hypothetical protein
VNVALTSGATVAVTVCVPGEEPSVHVLLAMHALPVGVVVPLAGDPPSLATQVIGKHSGLPN